MGNPYKPTKECKKSCPRKSRFSGLWLFFLFFLFGGVVIWRLRKEFKEGRKGLLKS